MKKISNFLTIFLVVVVLIPFLVPVFYSIDMNLNESLLISVFHYDKDNLFEIGYLFAWLGILFYSMMFSGIIAVPLSLFILFEFKNDLRLIEKMVVIASLLLSVTFFVVSVLVIVVPYFLIFFPK